MTKNMGRIAWPVVLAVVIWAIGAWLGVKPTVTGDGLTYGTPHGFAELFQKGLFDLAIAIVIAVAVRELIERAREANENRRSAMDIFREAYGTFFSNELLQQAIDAIFSARLVRDEFKIEYTFDRHPRSPRLLHVDTLVEYTIENVSDVTETHNVAVMLANVMANFPNDPEQEKPTILSAKVGDTEFTPEKLAELNSKIDASEENPRMSLEIAKITPKSKLHVRTEIRVVKLANDADTMRMAMATKSAEVKIVNHVGPELDIKIGVVGHRPFGKKEFLKADKSEWVWKVPALLLPQNGWVLYWNDLSRNPSDLGDARRVVTVEDNPV